MAKKSDTLNHEKGRSPKDQSMKRDDALNALRRLRDIGKKLPVIDAAAIIRESRDLAGQDSH
jgi:hypothetical protein